MWAALPWGELGWSGLAAVWSVRSEVVGNEWEEAEDEQGAGQAVGEQEKTAIVAGPSVEPHTSTAFVAEMMIGWWIVAVLEPLGP